MEKEEIVNENTCCADASKTNQLIKNRLSTGVNYHAKTKGIILERLEREKSDALLYKHISMLNSFLNDCSKYLFMLDRKRSCTCKKG